MPNKNKSKTIVASTDNRVVIRAPVPAGPAFFKKPKSGKKKRKVKGIIGGGFAVPQFVAANLNPFLDSSIGVKVPDEFNGATTAVRGSAFATGTTDATYGAYAIGFTPDPNAYAVSAATIASATSWTWSASVAGLWAGGSTLANIAALRNSFGTWRSAAWGVRVGVQDSYANAKGVLHVITLVPDLTESGWPTSGAPTSISQMSLHPTYQRIPIPDLLMNPIIIPGRVYDSTNYCFRGTNQEVFATTTGSQIGNPACIFIAVTGGSTSEALLDIQYVNHLECTPNCAAAGTYVNSGSDAEPSNPTLMAAFMNFVGGLQTFYQDNEQTLPYLKDLVRSGWKLAIQRATSNTSSMMVPF